MKYFCEIFSVCVPKNKIVNSHMVFPVKVSALLIPLSMLTAMVLCLQGPGVLDVSTVLGSCQMVSYYNLSSASYYL